MDYVALWYNKNRGWPWPGASFGLDPMYGPDGWCHTCAIPKHVQTGSLVLEKKGLTNAEGAWIPYDHDDIICADAPLAREIASTFDIELREIAWPRNSDNQAFQLQIPVGTTPWFNPSELEAATTATHGRAGSTCEECGTWRWLGLGFDNVSPLVNGALDGAGAIIASPEWFGSVRHAYREVRLVKELADLLAARSPQDLKLPRQATVVAT